MKQLDGRGDATDIGRQRWKQLTGGSNGCQENLDEKGIVRGETNTKGGGVEEKECRRMDGMEYRENSNGMRNGGE